MDEFKGFLNLVLLIVFVAATVLGPLVERWRKRKEMERRAQRPPAASSQAEAAAEEPASPKPEAKLPYEEVLHELFGPYMERRKREAEEARRRAEAEAEAEEEAAAEAIEVVEETPPPVPAESSGPRFVHAETSAPAFVHVETTVPRLPTAVAGNRGVQRTLDEIVFRNPRLTPGAKLLLASEILGKPRALRR